MTGDAPTQVDSELSALAGEPAPVPELDALYRELSARMREERGPAAWLRSRSTPVRSAIAVLAIGAFALLVWLSFARPDLAAHPPPRMAWTLGAISALLIFSLVFALRPLHLPAAPRWLMGAVLGGGLLLLLGIYTLPAAGTSGGAQPPGAVLHGAWKCFGTGAVLGLPVYLLLRLLDRGSSPYGVAMALSAGLSANLLLQLHCPVSAPPHMVLGHLGVALAFVAAYLVHRRAQRRVR